MEQDVNRWIMQEFKRNQDLLVALGDETRQRILMGLAQQPQDALGMRVGEIGQYTHLSRPAISHHLKVLKEAGIVNMHREGTKNYYRLDAKSKIQGLQSLMSEFLSLCE
ncbi:ArsR/SmtB family transcription factor [Saccharibacillus qingshengii]|uniref:ArsR/SmtB family transcription factor n=1 Tax=Saccharibacillus qingshengii TaxID=1763540 RepID=UPI0015553FB4|nr:metalloregulator ArsR/SmtB family transcription factor [Saccharibacillus qingshengii]